MKNESFYEILVKKIQEKEAVQAAPASSTDRLRDEKIQSEILWTSFFTETVSAKFSEKTVNYAAAQSAAKKYPYTPRKNRSRIKDAEVITEVAAQVVAAPPPPPVEKWVLKSTLDEDGQSKWNLFETTLGMSFGEKITPATARSCFRKFLKKVHPDLSGEKTTHNFSTLVKIKDEFIRALDAQLAKTL